MAINASSGSSYYLQIDNKLYDRELVAAFEDAVKTGGRISKKEAKVVHSELYDAGKRTEIEDDTFDFCMKMFGDRLTPAAAEQLEHDNRAQGAINGWKKRRGLVAIPTVGEEQAMAQQGQASQLQARISQQKVGK